MKEYSRIQHNENERLKENMIKRKARKKRNDQLIQAYNLRQRNKERSMNLQNLKWEEDKTRRNRNKIQKRLDYLEKEKTKLEKEKKEYQKIIQNKAQKREEISKNAMKLNFVLTNEKDVCVSDDELRTGIVIVSEETKRLIKLKLEKQRR